MKKWAGGREVMEEGILRSEETTNRIRDVRWSAKFTKMRGSRVGWPLFLHRNQHHYIHLTVFSYFTFAPVFPAAKFMLLGTTRWHFHSFAQNQSWLLTIGNTRKKCFLFCISRSPETPVLSAIFKSSFPFTLYSLFSYSVLTLSECARPSEIIGCMNELSR